jgi:hypothetical protein
MTNSEFNPGFLGMALSSHYRGGCVAGSEPVEKPACGLTQR